MNQKLYYNVTGQTLYWDAPEGRADSITSVEVFEMATGDDGTAESATTGSAAVETNPNTTFDANSGAGETDPRLMNLAATTGIAIGRQYLITAAAGEKEWVEVTDITSAASASARNPLANAYVSGDTFEGTRISISVADAWIQDENNVSDDLDPNPGYRVRWTYVLNSVTYVHDSYFDVVRYKEDHDVTSADIDAEFPGWMYNLPTEDRTDRGARLIDAAYASVKAELMAADVAIEMLRNREVLNRMVMLKAVENAERARIYAGTGGDLTRYEIAKQEFHSYLDSTIKVVHRTAMSLDGEGAGERTTAVSLWER